MWRFCPACRVEDSCPLHRVAWDLLALLRRAWEETIEPEVPLDSIVDCVYCGLTGEHTTDCLLLLVPAAISRAEGR